MIINGLRYAAQLMSFWIFFDLWVDLMDMQRMLIELHLTELHLTELHLTELHSDLLGFIA